MPSKRAEKFNLEITIPGLFWKQVWQTSDQWCFNGPKTAVSNGWESFVVCRGRENKALPFSQANSMLDSS